MCLILLMLAPFFTACIINFFELSLLKYFSSVGSTITIIARAIADSNAVRIDIYEKILVNVLLLEFSSVF